MYSAEYPVSLHRADGVKPATLYCWDQAPDAADQVLLRLESESDRLQALASNFTDALTDIRRRLEAKGALLACNGAAKNVHASGMSASMGVGASKAAATADLICIFGPTNASPSTLAAQEAFYERWLKSLSV